MRSAFERDPPLAYESSTRVKILSLKRMPKYPGRSFTAIAAADLHWGWSGRICLTHRRRGWCASFGRGFARFRRRLVRRQLRPYIDIDIEWDWLVVIFWSLNFKKNVHFEEKKLL